MIGESIKSLLANSGTLTTLVGAKIFPYVMDVNTTLPAVVYTIDKLSPEYTKGGWVGDNCAFGVHVFSKDYAELQSVVAAVRNALELKNTGYGTADINRIALDGMDEGFDVSADVFYNKLSFTVRINKY